MDYEQMTVKELAERAMINRKTFYLHYNSLDDLLLEMQNEMAQSFIEKTRGMARIGDIDKITRGFFMSCGELGKFGERITSSGSYHYISRRITADIMSQTWKEGDSGFSDPYLQNIIKAIFVRYCLNPDLENLSSQDIAHVFSLRGKFCRRLR